MRIKALFVDDEPLMRRAWQRQFERHAQVDLRTCEGGERALKMLEAAAFDVVVADVQMPEVSGLELLKQIKARHPATEVIMLTGQAEFDGAVTAGRLGAFAYLQKQGDRDHHLAVLLNAARVTRLTRENSVLRARASQGLFFSHSPSMVPVQRMLDMFAPTDLSVLLLGPNGVGKTLLAKEIHARSPRAHGPFLTFDAGQNAAGIWESRIHGHLRGAFTGSVESRAGVFEEATGGTVFLDEIGDIPLAQQSALLRVLQEGKVQRLGSSLDVDVDVRVISATNRDIQAMINRGEFRSDLYHRLKFEEVHVPALAQRTEDIPMLAQRFVAGTTAARVAPDALAAFMRYPWPGNVRELRRVIARAAVLAGRGDIEPEHLPEGITEFLRAGRASAGFVDCNQAWKAAIEPAEDAIRAHYLRTVLDRHDGNMTKAAKAAGLDRANFRRHVRRHLPEWRR